MSRICQDCKCEDKVKVIEENLVLLKNLYIRKDSFIEGNLLVKGKITDETGNLPNLGSGNVKICTTATTTTFNINQANPCQLIVQEPTATQPAQVIFGSQTPNGIYLIINYGPHAVAVVDVSNPSVPVFIVPNTLNSQPIVAKVEFLGGGLVLATILVPA